jgi:hypothetical protein
LRVQPDPVAFSDTFVGCTRSIPVEIVNADVERSLTVTKVSSSSPSIRVLGVPGFELGPGDTRTLEARFAPTEVGRVEGSFDFRTDEPAKPVYQVRHAATGVETPPGPLDLVFVLDVSTSMDEIAMLRAAIETLFDTIEAEALDVRVGLATFENDVVVHRRGAFLDRKAFFRELDTQLVDGTWIPDSDLPRQLLNFELEENLLDALYGAATEFEFRSEARRFLFVVTDDTFLEPPAVFSDGNPVRQSYAEVAAALAEREIGLFSVHVGEKGEGLSSSYRDQASLVALTGGDWLELSDVRAESVEVMLDGLLTRPDCQSGNAESR